MQAEKWANTKSKKIVLHRRSTSIESPMYSSHLFMYRNNLGSLSNLSILGNLMYRRTFGDTCSNNIRSTGREATISKGNQVLK